MNQPTLLTWKSSFLKAIGKWTLAVIIIVIIMGVVGATVYLTRRQVTPAFSLAPSSLIAVQGANITFTVYGLEPKGVATIYFGDGQEANTTSTLIHAYGNSGRYLVGGEESVNGQPVASTFNALQTIEVTSQVNESLAPMISLPAIAFDVNRNPSAPIVQVGDQVSLYGGFLEAPTGTNITITQYNWDFGNGVTKTITANSTSLKPVDNPAVLSYNQAGLYTVKLTLVTQNSTSMATYNTSVEQTVAVESASEPFAVFLYAGVVANPSVINVANNFGDGPFSLDPQVDYEIVGAEVMANIYSDLLTYNATPGIQLIPLAAAQLPSVGNGGISPDYRIYTFQIRTGMKFSNGDPLTAYDVWYSMVRDLLFVGGNTATAGWMLAQYLIPGATAGVPIMTASRDTSDFNAIMNSLTYSNSSNTVTFKLVNPTLPQLFFTGVATTCGVGIIDASWLKEVGAGIAFTPAGFYAYQNEANLGNLDLEVENNPVASGPYMIQSYVPGQSITLVPNPGFPGVPGIPAVNDTVVIQWVKDPQTAYNLFKSGQADTVEGLPPSYLALIPKLVADGEAAMYETPTLTEYFNMFNLDINATNLKTNSGPQYHIPSDYFDNLDVREAFAYAFNYTYYLDEILGNKKYGIDFGNSYAGVIIPGLPDYVPPSQLRNIPTFNLTEAKQLLEQSGEYGVSINIPVFTLSGQTNSFAGIQMWGAALNSIDPNIVMTPVYISVPSYFTLNPNPGQFPIPLFVDLPWEADYPYPSDFVDGMYKQGGYYPAPFGWSVQCLNSTGHADQAKTFAEMNSLLQVADSTTNATLAAQDYKAAEQLAINLYMYVYTYVPNYFLVVKPYMHGYQNVPLIYAAGYYDYYVKTCGSTQACSGRGIGP
jgi:ABC-type transport system substrate-binding protein